MQFFGKCRKLKRKESWSPNSPIVLGGTLGSSLALPLPLTQPPLMESSGKSWVELCPPLANQAVHGRMMKKRKEKKKLAFFEHCYVPETAKDLTNTSHLFNCPLTLGPLGDFQFFLASNSSNSTALHILGHLTFLVGTLSLE